MAAKETVKGTRCKMNSKIQWTDKMNDDLLDANRKLWIWLSQETHRESSRGEKKRLHGCDERSMGNNGISRARFVKSESSRPSSEALEDASRNLKGRSYATILDLKAQGIEWIDRKVY